MINEEKGKIKINLGEQGKLILATIVIFYGYFGIFSNMVMNDGMGHQLVYPNWDSRLVLWNFLLYPRTYFLPLFLILLISFLYTFLQDIPEYGIKGAIWFAVFTIFLSFHWYSKLKSPFAPLISIIFYGNIGSFLDFFKFKFMYIGEAFELMFLHWQGYVMILILFASFLGGAFAGMYLKKYIISRKKKLEENLEIDNNNKKE
ncbi:MAG: hypothetical protein ACTSWX_12450 [Promethearchaeota archaeon]